MGIADEKLIKKLYKELETDTRSRLDRLVHTIIKTKEAGGKVAVVTGSGPNVHEGVTTLLAELINKGLVDGVITSSAVVAHEMAGSLDRVKRIKGAQAGVPDDILPKGSIFEITLMNEETLNIIKSEMHINTELLEKAAAIPGDIIIKAAGNMAYPMGLRTERLSAEIETASRMTGKSFEFIAGLGADQRTMIGAGAQSGVPVIVSVPQLIGGGMVGLAAGDSISVKQRCMSVAKVLSGSSLIIESGIALSQEIHDGPFETYTGHGIWSAWEGTATYSLKEKTLVRIDLDPNLEKVWRMEKNGGDVQVSVDRGLPKTKTLKVPFRMEMSGFARLESSIPIVGDLGVIWPVAAYKISEALGIELDFISYPQETEQGKEMREWIVDEVKILNRQKMRECVAKI
jgi:hypothetical protein